MPSSSDRPAVVIPLRSFDDAKTRLAERLGPTARAALVRRLANGVLDAVGGTGTFIVTNDQEVADWAGDRGATAVRSDPGLNAAAATGVTAAAHAGHELAAVVHGDLALPGALAAVLLDAPAGTIVADRHGDGTNLIVVPTGLGFAFDYGPDSFERHLAALDAAGIVRREVTSDLGWDVDTPADLDDLARRGVDVLADRTYDLATPGVAVAIGAHPDDIEFGAGATLAKWADAGASIVMVVLTDGSKGTWDPTASTDSLAATRVTEQHAAARQLSERAEVHMLGAVDGELVDSIELRVELGRIIRSARPDVILGHDPWKRYRLHPDHRVGGQLVIDAIVGARDPHFFTELHLEPHRPDHLLLFEPDEPNHLERVTDAHLASKLAALESHQSQFETTHFSGVDQQDPLDGFRQRERRQLIDAAVPFQCDLGEAFHRMDDL